MFEKCKHPDLKDGAVTYSGSIGSGNNSKCKHEWGLTQCIICGMSYVDYLRQQLQAAEQRAAEAEAREAQYRAALERIAAERPLTGPLNLSDLDMQEIAREALAKLTGTTSKNEWGEY
jgi:hypothetical protein